MRLAVLTSHNPHQYALLHALAREHELALIVFEDVGAKKPKLFKRRLKKLGLLHVANQVLFKVLDVAFFKPRARKQMEYILGKDTEWQPHTLPEAEMMEVDSLNTDEMRQKIARVEPDAVVVSGTGILGKKLIDVIHPRPIINIHCGITPRYRGTHGAFWAVVNKDWENIGTTVHYIDEGIDTGGILAQGTFQPEAGDNPRTLVLKQYRTGVDLMLQTLEKIGKGEQSTLDRPDLDSRLYSSPTFTAWLKFRKNVAQVPENIDVRGRSL